MEGSKAIYIWVNDLRWLMPIKNSIGLSLNCLHSSTSCDPHVYQVYTPFFLLFLARQTQTKAYVKKFGRWCHKIGYNSRGKKLNNLTLNYSRL